MGQAIYFDSGEHQLFGWFHAPPAGAMANVGLVICKPFGYEALCSHRGLRAFAEAAAARGVPTLRIDYLGTGDSAEIDPQVDQLKAWTRDVISAVDELRRRTAVQHVCLLGVRFGALLAALAADDCAAVTSLILIAPIVSGRRYLRELRTTRMFASQLDAQLAGVEPAPSDTEEVKVGGMEVSGFWLSAATLDALTKVDLKTYASPTVTDALVISGKGLPGASVWAQHLAGLGIRTQYLVLPGLVEMAMTAPQFAAVPQEMIAAMRDWLGQLSQGSAPSAAGTDRQVEATLPPPAAVMTLRSDDAGPHAVVTERPVFFGSDTPLFGIVTEPRHGEIRRRGIILLNAGADYHISANGMHVELAREWAQSGCVVLRMDLAGLGDSATRAGQPDNEVFPQAALDDIRAAIEFLRSRYGTADITLYGLCSGAYHALRAAAAGVPVNRILMVNPQNYFWTPGTALNDLQPADIVYIPKLYRLKLFTREAWKRLLTGQVDVWRVAKIYFNRPLMAAISKMRDLARRLRIRLPNDLGRELEEICKRGVRIIFVFTHGEPGIDLLKIEAGSSVKRLGESCRIHIIVGADHIFSQSAPRATLKKILSNELFVVGGTGIEPVTPAV
jgi:alpha-beta hydrolase superfamily lysophospholipase